MKTQAEKRRSRRVRLESSAHIKLPETNGESAEVLAVTRDISSRGVFFYLDRELAAGSQFEMVVMLPEEISQIGRAWMCCRGTVVRVENGTSETGGREFGIAAELDRCSVLPEI